MARPRKYGDFEALRPELQGFAEAHGGLSRRLLLEKKRNDLLKAVSQYGGFKTVKEKLGLPAKELKKQVARPNRPSLEDVLAAKKGDAEAIKRVLEKIDPLIKSIARSKAPYLQRGGERADMDVEDLVQVGRLILHKKMPEYDPELETEFSTFITPWIKQAMDRSMGKEAFKLRVPEYQRLAWNRMNRVKSNFESREGKPPTQEELRKELGWSLEKLEKTQSLAPVMEGAGSTDEPVSPESEGTRGEPFAAPPVETMEQRIGRKKLRQTLLEEIEARLDAREQKVILERHLTEPQRTFEEIGSDLGVSHSRAQIIEKRARKKLARSPRLFELKDLLEE